MSDTDRLLEILQYYADATGTRALHSEAQRCLARLVSGTVVIDGAIARLNGWADKTDGRWEAFGPVSGLGLQACGVELFDPHGRAIGEGIASDIDGAVEDAIAMARAKRGGS